MIVYNVLYRLSLPYHLSLDTEMSTDSSDEPYYQCLLFSRWLSEKYLHFYFFFFLAALHISPRGFYFNTVYFSFMRKGRYNTKFRYAKQCFLAFIPGFVLLTFKSWTLVPSRWFSKQAYMELQSLPWLLPENLPDRIHSSDADFYRVAQPSPLGSNFLSRRPGLPEGNSTHIF